MIIRTIRNIRFAALLLSAAALILAAPAQGSTLAYSHDFQWDVGAPAPYGWSAGTIQSAPNPDYDGWRRFLGEFVNETVTLSLNDLAPHAFVQVEFDLYLLRSWDGESDEFGKDFFGFRADGSQLLRESFSNGGAGQSYCGSACVSGQSVYAPMTGAAETYSLGYRFDNWLPESPKYGTSEVMDSVYHFSFTFAHGASNLQLAFFGEGLQPFWVNREGGGYWDESWGLDNVSVHLMPVPEPQTWALLLAGFLLAFAARRRAAADF